MQMPKSMTDEGRVKKDFTEMQRKSLNYMFYEDNCLQGGHKVLGAHAGVMYRTGRF